MVRKLLLALAIGLAGIAFAGCGGGGGGGDDGGTTAPAADAGPRLARQGLAPE